MGRRNIRGLTRTRAALATVMAVVTSLGLGVSSQAGTLPRDDPGTQKKKVDRQIGALRDDLVESGADLRNAYVALQRTQARLPGARTALASAQARADAAAVAQANAEQDLEVARANEAKAEDELASTTTQISESRASVANLAAQLYQNQGLGQLDLVVGATSPQQFADRLAMSDTVLGLQSESLTRLETARATQVALEAHVSALRAESEAAKTRADEAAAAAVHARNQAASAKASLDGLARTQAGQARVLSVRVASTRARLSAAQTESDRLARVLAIRAAQARAAAARRAAAVRKAEALRAARIAAQQRNRNVSRAKARSRTSTSSSPADDGGVLASPMPGAGITSVFGRRYHPILHYWRLHAGIDFAEPCGTPVHAAADGVIVMAGYRSSPGNQVVIDHGLLGNVGLATAYDHLQRITVYGGRVRRGQVIGYEGSTGLSTGCHLHFEVRQNGTPVNPFNWL